MKFVPWGLIILGAALSLAIAARLPLEGFLSGDAGLKALQVRQFAVGDVSIDLHPPASEPWVAGFWREKGLFPFEPPFVYPHGNEKAVAFPPYFELAAAPLFHWMGYRGLRVLSLVALWGLWLIFAGSARQLDLGSGATTVGLLGLMAATPCTLYGLLFWEHALATFLIFAGVAYGLLGNRFPGPGGACLGGLSLGLGVWVREEAAWLAVPACALVLLFGILDYRASREPHWRGRGLFLATAAATALALFGINHALFGEILGFHWRETQASFHAASWWPEAKVRCLEMWTQWVCYGPVILVVPAALLLRPVLSARRWDRRRFSVLALVLVFALSVPLLAPNDGGLQWGPRFLLPTYPLLALWVACSVDTFKRSHRPLVALLVVAPGVVLGGWMNLVNGTREIERKCGALEPALRYLEAEPQSVVAVSNQYLSQEMEALFGQKSVFLTRGKGGFQILVPELVARGQREFLYVCSPAQSICPKPTRGGVFRHLETSRGNFVLRLDHLRQLDPVYIYTASILPVAAEPSALPVHEKAPAG